MEEFLTSKERQGWEKAALELAVRTGQAQKGAYAAPGGKSGGMEVKECQPGSSSQGPLWIDEDRAKIRFKTGKFQAATSDDNGWALSGADALRQRRASA